MTTKTVMNPIQMHAQRVVDGIVADVRSAEARSAFMSFLADRATDSLVKNRGALLAYHAGDPDTPSGEQDACCNVMQRLVQAVASDPTEALKIASEPFPA